MPDGELACGFVSGVDEIGSWDAADLFQFRMDTVPVLGDLESLLPPMGPQDAVRAAHVGACAVYHACVHNLFHERSAEILDSLYKQARFVLRAKVYSETGTFLRTTSDLIANTEGADRTIASGPRGDLLMDSETLISWSSDIIIGPVADDGMYGAIGMYEAGLLDRDETLRRLDVPGPGDQYVFVSEESLSDLVHLGVEPV